jgi:DNA-directed RNA polymerase specialized sigma24 family protein
MLMDAVADAWSSEVTRAAGGDRDAYRRLVDRTRATVASIALALLGDVAASEDVAQEVYLAVWLELPRLRNPTSFVPWLRQLTRNRAHDAVRRGVRRPVRLVVTVEALDGAVDLCPDVVVMFVGVEE